MWSRSKPGCTSDLRHSARRVAPYCYYKSGDNQGGMASTDPSEEGRRRRIEQAVESQRKAVELLTQLRAEAPGRRDYAEALQAAWSHLGLIML